MDKDRFSEAVTNANVSEVKYILESGSNDVNSKDKCGRTALFHACARNSLSLVEVLLEYGADVNVRDTNGNTAMHWCGQIDILESLVMHGAMVLVRNKLNITPRDMATRRGVSKELIDKMMRHEKNEIHNANFMQSPTEYPTLLREFYEEMGTRNIVLLISGILCFSLYFAYIITGGPHAYEETVDIKL